VSNSEDYEESVYANNFEKNCIFILCEKFKWTSIIAELKKKLLLNINININPDEKIENFEVIATTQENQDITSLLKKYYWKPFEKFCKQYHDGVNINIYNNKYFSNISKNSLILIETKRDCNINKILDEAERHLFYYQPLFKEFNEIILILIIYDPFLRISFDNKNKINNLEEIQNKYNVKLMILI